MKTLTIWFVLIMFLPIGSAVLAQEEGGAEVEAGEDDVIEMHGVDKLDTLLGFVQLMTDRIIVYDAGLKNNKVKIYGTARILRKNLIRFVETILEMNGYTMIDAPGNVLRVIQTTRTGEPIALRIGREEDLPDSSATVTQVITLKYADTSKVNALVRGMITAKEGKVTMYDDLNIMFITDAAYKIKKILTVIDLIDKPKPKVILETVKVEHAPATELAKTLDNLMQRKATREKAGKKSINRAYIVADGRSNSIIILGLVEEIADVKKVLATLDMPLEPHKGVFHSYKLKNTSAADLAKVLIELYQKKAVAERGRKGVTPQELARQPSIVPEPNSNSLLIIAPPDVYAEIKKLIIDLDVRRPQVLIEVMLVEVTLDQTRDIGIELATGDEPKSGRDTIYAGTGFGLSSITLEDGKPVRIPSFSGTGLFAGVFRGTAHIPAILRAWETQGDVDVLSVPRVVTDDNSDAVISIGDEVPYQKQTLQNQIRDITWGTARAMMELKITPHISEADYLRLDLSFKVERFGAQPDVTAPPPKSTRNATTKVTIPNESTVIIGGLTRVSMRDTENRIPGLSRIPLLGRLFKRTIKVRTKTNLFIFITPHILRGEDFEDLKSVSSTAEVKMREVRGKDWRQEVGLWSPVDRMKGYVESETLPEIIPLEVETVIGEEKPVKTEIKEEKDAGEPEDAFKSDKKRDRRRR